MSASLTRLLRLRSLLEDSTRMELERRAAFAARVDGAQQRERQSIRDSRQLALRAICEDGPAEQAHARSTEWTSAEAAAWREQQLAPLAEAASRRVAEGRGEFFDRRKERQQVESILDAENTRLLIESERRTQRELDDWFAMKLIRQRNRGPQS
jgi:hypothetical protein